MSEQPYASDAQNAIFNFLFVLIDDYRRTMPLVDAVEKACDWLTSLASEVKAKTKASHADTVEKQKLFNEYT
jgi:hypothetical protein